MFEISAQPGGDGETTSVSEVLGFVGLSCGSLAVLILASLAWFVVSIALGARLAGLRATIGRALAAPLAGLLFAIPLGVLLALVSSSWSAPAQVMAGQAASSLAAFLAIKWVFKAPWGHALLAFFLSSIITMVGVIFLLIVFI